MHFFDAINFGSLSFGQLPTVVWLLLFLALLFDFLNGFHDAANSVATVVSTRVLSPQAAVFWAAFFNFVAFLVFNLNVATTMGKGIIDPGIVDNKVIAATLIAACAWDIITWYWGLPTSSSHALIGGMVGAALCKALAVTGKDPLQWYGIGKTLVFIFLAPMIGFLTGRVVAIGVVWAFRHATPLGVDRLFRRGQLASASLYSLGHGGNDAQKTMGIMFVLLLAAVSANPAMAWRDRFVLTDKAMKSLSAGSDGLPASVLSSLETIRHKTFSRELELKQALSPSLSAEDLEKYEARIVKAADNAQVPTEVVLACHLAMGIGTLFGGWRIVKTMGQRIMRLRPVDGFCAETGAATTLAMTVFGGIPVSTTHTITGAIVGVGSMKRMSAIRWRVAGSVVWAWILTIPASALIAAVSWWSLRLF